MTRLAHSSHIGLTCLLAVLLVGFASAEPLKSPAQLRKEQTAKLAEQLSGVWQLETAERTEDGKVYQNKFDNSKEPVCLVTFSDGKVVSKTKDGVPEVTKETASSELFLPGSTLQFRG